ncbi:MAG: hypothetical protein NWF01_07550 [Candidatus Bathyarchaeota archaeon]|nr:hypothetical protein [Candidatus Bathyarchaeota archaeon]
MGEKIVTATMALVLVMLLPCIAVAQIENSTWNIETVEHESHISYFYSSCIALDSNNSPHICYNNQRKLMYAYQVDSTWNRQIVDTNVLYQATIGIVMDSSDKPHICFFTYNSSTYQIMYGNYNGTEWNIQTVDQTEYGAFSSLVLDTNNNPHISYNFEFVNDTGIFSSVKYASWNGTTWNIQIVAPHGFQSALALDSAENPHICYNGEGELKYAVWTGSAWNIQTIDNEGGSSPSLVLDGAWHPHVSYSFAYPTESGHNIIPDLKYAYWNGASWSIQTLVKAFTSYSTHSSIALDAQGVPHIAYIDSTNRLRYTILNNTYWTFQTVDAFVDPQVSPSLTIDTQGNPHLSYENKYAYYGTPQPTPTPTTTEKGSPIPVEIFYAIIIVAAISVITLLLLRKRHQ